MLQPIAVPETLILDDLSDEAERLLVEAADRIAEFTRRHQPRIDNFVICDFRLVDAALAWILSEDLACGDRFCEWGSGFGVVAMLAAQREMESYGIEVEPALVSQAQQLADDLQIDARFAAGSFIPEGAEDALQFVEDIEHIDTDCPSAYHELDLEVADFDLCFAFPWPGEHGFWEAVFDRYASDGALLLTYHGMEGVKLQRRLAVAPD